MSERAGFLRRLSDRLDDRWDWYGPVGEYGTLLSRVACFFNRHEPGPDQCNIPDHDFCQRCGKSMPNSSPYRKDAEC